MLFGLLGAAAAPLVGWDDVWTGVALTWRRPVCARRSSPPAPPGPASTGRSVLTWCGGLKGAVPLLLATLPALELLDASDRVQGIVLVATATSIAVQGPGLRLVAARGASVPA